MPTSSKRTPSKGTKTPASTAPKVAAAPSRVPKTIPGAGGSIKGVKPIPLPGRSRGR
jgi:hypothetical protein